MGSISMRNQASMKIFPDNWHCYLGILLSLQKTYQNIFSPNLHHEFSFNILQNNEVWLQVDIYNISLEWLLHHKNISPSYTLRQMQQLQ